jgi:hypothetical protein
VLALALGGAFVGVGTAVLWPWQVGVWALGLWVLVVLVLLIVLTRVRMEVAG